MNDRPRGRSENSVLQNKLDRAIKHVLDLTPECSREELETRVRTLVFYSQKASDAFRELRRLIREEKMV